MSTERDHHYVPQSHLRKWADSAGLVKRWGRISHNSKLVQKRVSPAATGYVPEKSYLDPCKMLAPRLPRFRAHAEPGP